MLTQQTYQLQVTIRTPRAAVGTTLAFAVSCDEKRRRAVSWGGDVVGEASHGCDALASKPLAMNGDTKDSARTSRRGFAVTSGVAVSLRRAPVTMTGIQATG